MKYKRRKTFAMFKQTPNVKQQLITELNGFGVYSIDEMDLTQVDTRVLSTKLYFLREVVADAKEQGRDSGRHT